MGMGAGEIVYEDELTALSQPVTSKTAATDRTNNTLSADPELTGIRLEEGIYRVRLILFFTTPTSTTPKIKTRWTFSGTWNNPIRACMGPGSAQVAARTDMTEIQLNGVAAGSDCVYSAAASTGFNVATEEALDVTVTVAGDLSLSWAQNVTNANITSVKAGSGFVIHKRQD